MAACTARPEAAARRRDGERFPVEAVFRKIWKRQQGDSIVKAILATAVSAIAIIVLPVAAEAQIARGANEGAYQGYRAAGPIGGVVGGVVGGALGGGDGALGAPYGYYRYPDYGYYEGPYHRRHHVRYHGSSNPGAVPGGITNGGPGR